MKNAVFFKTFSGYLLTALGLAALVLFFSFRTIRQYYLNTLTNDLRDLCVAVEPQALTYIASHDPAGLDGFIKKLEVQTHKRITVLDGRGAVIADSENDPKTMPDHRDRPEVARALGGNVGSSLRYSSTIMENMLYVAVPVEEEDGTLVLRLHVADDDIGKVIGRQGRLARALRTIVRAGGVEAGRRLQLEIAD
jgi:two-component system phosphate regulon sensor histidine kinase PhoR